MSGNAKIITITINPEPVVSAGLDAIVCSDVVTGLLLNTNGSSVSAATYNIAAQTVDAGLTPAGTNVAVPANGVAANYLATNRYTNTGAIPLLVTYTVIPRSTAGCLGNPQSYYVYDQSRTSCFQWP
ncbi:MAG: hypothetical protein IPJ20_22315 [Flammeovirgaceae bacterium]|nr:hypothetical protein [Flammeovirgaceae bacterium]